MAVAKPKDAKADAGMIKLFVDCSQAQKDNIIDPAGLEKFFIDNIKREKKTGNFEKVDREGNVTKFIRVYRDAGVIHVEAVLPFKKRYLKYLTKKYMARQQIRDFLRVIATEKHGYTLKYFASVKAAGGV